MKRNRSLAMPLLAASALWLCAASAAAAPVTLRFRAHVGSQPFVCGQNYANQGSPPITATPQDFRVFVEQVRLIRSDNVEVPVSLAVRSPWQLADVALLDFENGVGACNFGDPGTNAVITGTVPDGQYKGIVFVNGVPEATWNHGDPATHTAPLNTPGSNWGWLLGYKFVVAQLGQVGGSGQGWAHTGSTGCTGNPRTGPVTCSRPNRNSIRLEPFDHTRDAIIVDIAPILASTNLTEDHQCHGSGDPNCSAMFAALGVDFSTGQATAGQQVYRVQRDGVLVPLPPLASWMMALGCIGLGAAVLSRGRVHSARYW